jgi:hypothetical protein
VNDPERERRQHGTPAGQRSCSHIDKGELGEVEFIAGVHPPVLFHRHVRAEITAGERGLIRVRRERPDPLDQPVVEVEEPRMVVNETHGNIVAAAEQLVVPRPRGDAAHPRSKARQGISDHRGHGLGRERREHRHVQRPRFHGETLTNGQGLERKNDDQARHAPILGRNCSTAFLGQIVRDRVPLPKLEGIAAGISGEGGTVKRRKRRHFVGTLPATLPTREFSIERTVDEGLLIALSAIRMAVKNRVILGVLRERSDFDSTEYITAAREQILLLAEQNKEYEKHFRSGALAASDGLDEEDSATESRRLERLSLVHNRISAGLSTVADDEEQVQAIIEAARQSAWDEIGNAWIDRMTRDLGAARDPDYDRQRAGRLQEFVYIDLAGLMVDDAVRR